MNLRAGLPPMPDRIKRLPVAENGYPIPWFVAELPQPDGSIKRDFRVADAEKRIEAMRLGRCYVCGGMLGAHKVFALGPMCAINLTTAEPPLHRDCAEWSVKACPFMLRPNMRRREGDYPETGRDAAGIGLERNPGVTLLWVTEKFTPFTVFNGVLIKVGQPLEVIAYREGRQATQEEVLESISSGFPALYNMAFKDGPEAMQHLAAYVLRTADYLKVEKEAMWNATFGGVLSGH